MLVRWRSATTSRSARRPDSPERRPTESGPGLSFLYPVARSPRLMVAVSHGHLVSRSPGLKAARLTVFRVPVFRSGRSRTRRSLTWRHARTGPYGPSLSAAGRHRAVHGEELFLDVVQRKAQRAGGDGCLSEERQGNAGRPQAVARELVAKRIENAVQSGGPSADDHELRIERQ